MLKTSSRLVRKANQASSDQLFRACTELKTTHTFRTLLAFDLREGDKDAIWAVFESNMRELYIVSSFGWDPPNKRAELFSSLSRFVLIDINDKLAGFAMFRFECEEEEDVVYCKSSYELQIERERQRSGLGRFLMQALEAIGAAWRMKKVVLTVFKSNLTAASFYQASGFSVDETSPEYSEVEHDAECSDYIILSKQINK